MRARERCVAVSDAHEAVTVYANMSALRHVVTSESASRLYGDASQPTPIARANATLDARPRSTLKATDVVGDDAHYTRAHISLFWID